MPTFLESLILKIFPSMDRFWEVFRFLAVGGGCFLLEYVLLFTLTEYGGLPPLVSAPIAFTISLLVNYILCVYVVFHAENQSTKQMVLFIVSHGAGAESACHVVLHRPFGDMVYVFESRGFRHRDGLELFHQALHPAWTCVRKSVCVMILPLTVCQLLNKLS